MPTLDIPATVTATGIYTTLVGGTSCISTNDGDTSYMQQHLVAGSGDFVGFNDNINFPATTIPGTVVSTSLVTVTKGTSPAGTATLFLREGVTQTWSGIFAEGAADWTELVTPLTVGGAEFVTQAMIEGGTVDYNPGSALLNAGAVGPFDVTLQWTYVALRVEYAAYVLAPPLRRYPPVNNGGFGPTRHHPRTVNRRVGGSY